jgi:uncharacterized protein YjdB
MVCATQEQLMRTIAFASLALVLVGTACSDRAPTGIEPALPGATTPAGRAVSRALAPDALPLAPQSGDRMLFDARPSINSASGIWRAVDGIAPGASYKGTWTFTSNVDGNGTNALRLDVSPRSTSACQMTTNAINIPLPQPHPTHLMVQWKQHLGRTASGGGLNRVGTYVLSDVCNGVNRSDMRAFRKTPVGDSLRLDYEWPSATSARVKQYRPQRVVATPSTAWSPSSIVGRTVTKTLYLQAESAPGANDGVVRLWVDGQLVIDQSHAAITPAAFKRLNFPGRMARPVAGQTEYWWDMIAWVPTLPGGDTTSTGGGGDTTSTGGTQDTTVATITISPTSPSILVGGSVQLQATVQNAAGDTLATPVSWSSADASVASVSPSGLVQGVSAGSAGITASAQGRSASTIVTVGNAPVASVAVSPKSDTMTVHGTRQLSVTVRDASGNVLTGRSVSWESLNSTLAAVDGNGLVTALAAGTARIRAVSEGIADTATLTINPEPPAAVATVTVSLNSPSIEVGQQTTAIATTKDASGNVLTGRAVTWTSSNAAIATVDTAGRVRAVAAGSASITATSEGKSGSATVTVTNPAPAPVATVTVSPATASVQAGSTVQLTATTRDGSGNVLTGRVVSWTSSNGAVATVSGSGLVTGVAAGSATITATSEGRSGTSSITVTAPPPPPTGSIVDPTLLPRATGQRPLAGSYGRSLRAGQTYQDPNSGVTVLKLTDNATPVSNGGMYHGYSEGGPNISQPWTGADGQTYYTAKIGGWLVDIRYSTLAMSNWRRVNYDGEIGFAFSLDPATPRIAYVVTGKQVNRYNTATNAVENTGAFPWIVSATGQYLDWLQIQVNDTWLVAMLNSNRTIVAFRTTDGLQRVLTSARGGVTQDEPHLDRQDPVVYLTGDAPPEQKIWRLETDDFIVPSDPNGINQDSHTAAMLGKAVAVGDWTCNCIAGTTSQGRVYRAVDPTPTNVNGDYHLAGQWVFGNTAEYFAVDQWRSSGAGAIQLGMIGLATASGTNDVRLLVASDAVGIDYGTGGQPHPTFAPDGRFVMWTTNMNGSARYDTFIARLPVR